MTQPNSEENSISGNTVQDIV